MKLKSFGCSFIFGSDLPGHSSKSIRPQASQSTWPARLAQQLDIPYECYAKPGIGNLQIMEQVLNQAARDEPAVFIIGWTWMDRFDYYNANWKEQDKMSPWQTITPTDTTDLANTYYRDLHSEYRDKLVNLSYIRLVVDLLKQKNIKFLMTYMDHLLFDQTWHYNLTVKELQCQTLPYMTDFEGQNFLDWSRTNGYDISESWHPLESAHKAAGDYMIKVFDKKNTNDPTQLVLF